MQLSRNYSIYAVILWIWLILLEVDCVFPGLVYTEYWVIMDMDKIYFSFCFEQCLLNANINKMKHPHELKASGLYGSLKITTNINSMPGMTQN
jgi:hypothetical protein